MMLIELKKEDLACWVHPVDHHRPLHQVGTETDDEEEAAAAGQSEAHSVDRLAQTALSCRLEDSGAAAEDPSAEVACLLPDQDRKDLQNRLLDPSQNETSDVEGEGRRTDGYHKAVVVHQTVLDEVDLQNDREAAEDRRHQSGSQNDLQAGRQSGSVDLGRNGFHHHHLRNLEADQEGRRTDHHHHRLQILGDVEEADHQIDFQDHQDHHFLEGLQTGPVLGRRRRAGEGAAVLEDHPHQVHLQIDRQHFPLLLLFAVGEAVVAAASGDPIVRWELEDHELPIEAEAVAAAAEEVVVVHLGCRWGRRCCLAAPVERAC